MVQNLKPTRRCELDGTEPDGTEPDTMEQSGIRDATVAMEIATAKVTIHRQTKIARAKTGAYFAGHLLVMYHFPIDFQDSSLT